MHASILGIEDVQLAWRRHEVGRNGVSKKSKVAGAQSITILLYLVKYPSHISKLFEKTNICWEISTLNTWAIDLELQLKGDKMPVVQVRENFLMQLNCFRICKKDLPLLTWKSRIINIVPGTTLTKALTYFSIQIY